MKKTSIFLLFIVLLFPLFVSGLTTTTAVVDLVGRIRDWIWAIFLVAVTISFLVAAFFFITAGGDPQRLQKAKDMVKYGIYGVIVGLLAGGMVALVENVLTTTP